MLLLSLATLSSPIAWLPGLPHKCANTLHQFPISLPWFPHHCPCCSHSAFMHQAHTSLTPPRSLLLRSAGPSWSPNYLAYPRAGSGMGGAFSICHCFCAQQGFLRVDAKSCISLIVPVAFSQFLWQGCRITGSQIQGPNLRWVNLLIFFLTPILWAICFPLYLSAFCLSPSLKTERYLHPEDAAPSVYNPTKD